MSGRDEFTLLAETGTETYMPKRDVHVVPRDQGWAVKKEGNDRASSVHPTQREAINAGRDAAKSERSELVIHDRQGRIRDSDSYGNDPHPPKDSKH